MCFSFETLHVRLLLNANYFEDLENYKNLEQTELIKKSNRPKLENYYMQKLAFQAKLMMCQARLKIKFTCKTCKNWQIAFQN